MRLLIKKYSGDNSPAPEQKFLDSLDTAGRARINSYQGRSRGQRLIGLELLDSQLRHFNVPCSLADLCRTPYNKPYFKDTAFGFSISHAGDFVLCLASVTDRVGVDVEFEDQALVDPDSDFLSAGEKEALLQDPGTSAFYRLHTRKEALAKALGLGVFLNHRDFDVRQDAILFGGSTWHLRSFKLDERYMVSCVSDGNGPLETILV